MPLIVKPIQAMLTKDKDFFSKQDPYCIIMIGNQKQRSRAHQGGGKKPRWTETFTFNSTDRLLRVSVYDEDAISDDLIGEGTYNLTQLYGMPGRTENEYIDLTYQGRSAGRILLSMEFQGQPMGGMGQYGGNQGGWAQQGGWQQGPPPQQWGGNQGGWGQQGPPPQQWGGNQGGWGQPPQQQGWGNQPPQNQGGWGQQRPPNQGGWGGNQGGWGGNQGGWGGNQGGYNNGW